VTCGESAVNEQVEEGGEAVEGVRLDVCDQVVRQVAESEGCGQAAKRGKSRNMHEVPNGLTGCWGGRIPKRSQREWLTGGCRADCWKRKEEKGKWRNTAGTEKEFEAREERERGDGEMEREEREEKREDKGEKERGRERKERKRKRTEREPEERECERRERSEESARGERERSEESEESARGERWEREESERRVGRNTSAFVNEQSFEGAAGAHGKHGEVAQLLAGEV
jgi:hypothetical protein